MKFSDNSQIKIVVMATVLSVAFALFIDLTWIAWKAISFHFLDDWGMEPTGPILTVYAAFWALHLFPIQTTFAQTSKKRNALSAAIRGKEKKDFMRYIDLQISWTTDLIFMVSGGMVLLMTFLMKFDWLDSLILVSMIASTMMFVRIIYLIRDNPIEGAWLFSPVWKFIRIGIWELKCLDPKWTKEAITRQPTDDCQ